MAEIKVNGITLDEFTDESIISKLVSRIWEQAIDKKSKIYLSVNLVKQFPF